MKKIYFLSILVLLTLNCFAQDSYKLGIVHISNYNFKVVAIPNFVGTNTNNLDAGFTLMMPAGSNDLINPVGLLGGRVWNVTQYDAATLTVAGGDGTQDGFQFNLPAGTTIFSHTTGQQIDLVSFDVTGAPISGTMEFLLNTDPLAIAAGGVFDSFYQTDLDGPGGNPTTDYFSGIQTGLENFNFAVLATDIQELLENQITIYPNPTSDYININSTLDITKVKIYDILGKNVLDAKNNTKINVQRLPVGVYFVKIYAGEGSITKKIIIN